MLLSNRAAVNSSDSEGNTPLHLACEAESREVYLALVAAGSRKDVKNKEGKTPLELAPM